MGKRKKKRKFRKIIEGFEEVCIKYNSVKLTHLTLIVFSQSQIENLVLSANKDTYQVCNMEIYDAYIFKMYFLSPYHFQSAVNH
jgi:hypothetical protein